MANIIVLSLFVLCLAWALRSLLQQRKVYVAIKNAGGYACSCGCAASCKKDIQRPMCPMASSAIKEISHDLG